LSSSCRVSRQRNTVFGVTGRRLANRASWTAQLCAAERAAETLQPVGRRLLDDPYSRSFVRDPVLRAVLTHRLAARAFIQVLDRLWGGSYAHVVLRARYTDDVCAAATTDGIDQFVLLGAGFDTTGLRTTGAPITIFEVDTPPTQQHKRTVYERLLPAPRNCQTVWVPCDFESDPLRERLLANGYDPTRPGLINWLGVIPYLTRHAIDTTLADLAALCAPSSRLVLDYIDADVPTGHTRWKSARRQARTVALGGEPYRTGFAATDLNALLAAHGFECREHTRIPALLQRYDPAHVSRLAGDDWLAIATAQRI
jgi:methyltransferase (TIGR00027 family)